MVCILAAGPEQKDEGVIARRRVPCKVDEVMRCRDVHVLAYTIASHCDHEGNSHYRAQAEFQYSPTRLTRPLPWRYAVSAASP